MKTQCDNLLAFVCVFFCCFFCKNYALLIYHIPIFISLVSNICITIHVMQKSKSINLNRGQILNTIFLNKLLKLLTVLFCPGAQKFGLKCYFSFCWEIPPPWISHWLRLDWTVISCPFSSNEWTNNLFILMLGLHFLYPFYMCMIVWEF